FSATVPEAPDEVRSQVHYVAQRAAGFGAAREVCEFILKHRARIAPVP
ncbi:MAG: 3-deoxy-D-manno-octulosonate 8-phosphate phosphatase, partial [Myxococcaceae bacterium]